MCHTIHRTRRELLAGPKHELWHAACCHGNTRACDHRRYRGNEGRKRTARMKEEEFDHIIDGFEFCEKIVAQVAALGPRAQNDVAHLFQVIASMCMDIATENSSKSERRR